MQSPACPTSSSATRTHLDHPNEPGHVRLGHEDTRCGAHGWEKFWFDEKVPALSGRTPRQATRSRERPYLEALLRQFEYEVGLLAADGKTGVDIAWLREQLDMPSNLAD
jgi:hypothetical protein